MKNISDGMDVNGDNFLKVTKQVCPHCKNVNQYINAEHLDNEYHDDLITYLKGELKKAKEVIQGYEEFCQIHDLPFGVVYELNKLRDYFNNRYREDGTK